MQNRNNKLSDWFFFSVSPLQFSVSKLKLIRWLWQQSALFLVVFTVDVFPPVVIFRCKFLWVVRLHILWMNDRPISVESLALAGEKNTQKKTSDFLVRLFTCRQEEVAQIRLVSLYQVQRPCPHLSELVTKAFVCKFVSSEPCPITSLLVSVCLFSETAEHM